MEKNDVIKNIAKRTGGDIYLGVVGAVRTGKSTFIKRMVETLIVPNIKDEYERKRALDEIPQSAAGKTIMTTEPKFVPNNAAKIKIDEVTCNIRLIDCVGYMIDKAQGASDENGPRMVKTPWYNEEIPFTEAAEIGTEKVIKDHSTIGIVVTTDGSIGEFQRNDYLEAETQAIKDYINKGGNIYFTMDTDFNNTQSKNTFTAGFGYRGSVIYADMAYKYDMYKSDFCAFDSNYNFVTGETDLLPAASVNNNRHQLVLTIGARF